MRTRCTWNAKLHRGMHESVFVRRIRYLIRELSGLLDTYSLIYYAIYIYISLHSFAAQEMNRRARATSNDRLCTRRMCASQYIYVLHVYTYTHTPLVHVEAWSFMVSLSTFCFMLAFAWIPYRTRLSTENSPCAYRFHHSCLRFRPDRCNPIVLCGPRDADPIL